MSAPGGESNKREFQAFRTRAFKFGTEATTVTRSLLEAHLEARPGAWGFGRPPAGLDAATVPVAVTQP